MSRLFCVFVLSFAVVVTAAGGEPAKDLAGFQGKWTFIFFRERGKDLPENAMKSLEATIKDDNLTVRQKDKVILELRIKVDAAKKDKTIDFTHLAGTDKDKTELGIYAFDGDNLWICTDEDGKLRPKEYESKENTSYTLVVMKRKK